MIDTPKLVMLVLIINILLATAMNVSENSDTIIGGITNQTLIKDNNKLEIQNDMQLNETASEKQILRIGQSQGNMGEAVSNLAMLFGTIRTIVFASAVAYIPLFEMAAHQLTVDTGLAQMQGIGLLLLATVVMLINFTVYLRFFNIIFSKFQG